MKVLHFVFALAGVFLFPSMAWPEEPTKELLHQTLQKTIAALSSSHLVVAVRGDNVSIQNTLSKEGVRVRQAGAPVPHFNVRFNEIWADGDNVQLRELVQEPNESDSWWEGFQATAAPLTADTLDSVAGRKSCFRPAQELMWADYITIPDSKTSAYRAMYSVSRSAQPIPGLFVPLVELNRKWVPPELSGGMPILNRVSQIPLEHWKVIGREEIGDSETVKVEIRQPESNSFPLKRRSATLTVTPIWVCWFSISQGYCPVKIISSIRYGIEGKEYDYVRSDQLDPMVRYVASDVKNVFDDIWFPLTGKQETYLPDYGSMKPFDADVAVDKCIADGKYIDREPFFLNTRREWKVLTLDKLPGVADLWFEAPNGTCIRDVDTGTLRMQGMSDEESRQFLKPASSVSSSGSVTPPLPEPRTISFVVISLNAAIVCGLVLSYFVKRTKGP